MAVTRNISTPDGDGVRTGPIVSMNQGHFLVNLITNIANFIVTVVVGLWMTPYLIHYLGITGYGLIPLITTVTSYLSVLTLSINASVGRFVTLLMERGEAEPANRVFNTALFSIVAILLVLLPVGIWIVSHAQLLLVIPAGYQQQAHWLFICAFAVFVLSQLASPFEIASYCRNRFDLRNGIAILTLLIRAGAIVCLFHLSAPRIWHVGIGYLLAAIVSVIGAVVVWRIQLPQLRIAPRLFDWAVLKALVGMGGWVVVNYIGSVLFIGIDLVIANRLLGPRDAGQYTTVLQWSVLLRLMAGTVAAVFGPPVLYLYARQNHQGLVTYLYRAVKFMGLALALPIGLICGFARPLLLLWVGTAFVPLAGLLLIITLHLCSNLATLPLVSVQIAMKRVRLPAMVTCVGGLLNLGLAVLLAGPVGWGMYGIAIAGALLFTANYSFFAPIYSARILGQPWSYFLKEMIPTMIATVLVGSAAWLLAASGLVASWASLIGVGCGIALAYVAIVFSLVLSAAEREMVIALLPTKMRRLLTSP